MAHVLDAGARSQSAAAVYAVLSRLAEPVHVVRHAGGYWLSNDGSGPDGSPARRLLTLGPLPPERLGSRDFLRAHGVRQCYQAGAMAGGISSADLVISMAERGLLASFGAAGLPADRLDGALALLERRLPGRPYACNVIHSPSEPAMERETVDACLRHGVRCVEASAFLGLTPDIVRYRARGLREARDGQVEIANRVIAKVSRREVAELFLRPAPPGLLDALLREDLITAEQARLAAAVPLADDITAESDSGGHTDGRPLTVLLGEIIALRDEIGASHAGRAARVGAAGGIGTPTAAAAAFTMGADYVVTGSINQACVESDQSAAAKAMLGAADMADCEMAPSADMFEIGAEVQVLRRGSMFAARARQLYELYRRHDGLADIPAADRAALERNVFRAPLEEVWAETRRYFAERDPAQLERAEGNERRRMALVFRWYLGLSSRWATSGAADRVADYQIWCGPAMGACNTWLRGTYLEPVGARRAPELAHHIMRGAAFHQRVAALRFHGVTPPPRASRYRPLPTTG
ncbi:PfaD family polyunsaturated fatty acid/polyketide biosynthesis protein [Frankia sp. AgB32]|uniref:PfaD family polyunsaturated fatty acid/polyketide biosynthesis protein n=1 Tax=Frankia sp. AgB32 TaxID=631119 RepID=UPI002010AA88|nr:PfaD family polyunsaturated fatty acid/polyketide biosynthesis protein [Frankia sp. AgB32]MCK9897351.1 PfaD family polyunsaturated fatty acid/polyketide biosynthesis protein [Frankia sp. AgB32]